MTIQKPIALALAASLLTACATNPDGSVRMDNRASGALVGALAGCGIARLTGGDCAKGAVVGGLVGFLVGWHFESKKTADAGATNKKYAKKQKIPKNEIKPVAFSSQISQKRADDGEKEIEVTSNTDLIGYGDKVPDVKQRYAIYDEKNQLVEEKTERLTAVDGAGSYQTKSSFKAPAEAKGKKYRMETTLMVDDKNYQKKNYTISWAPEPVPTIVAWR
jgi:hypothetical protein